ncbi:type II CRISPR-associated endonuclease Cas1 [Fredinandcohnia quinoae]|uniref:CRISPR-associated endonuclease Cas1 n=1 Tax=Fredinandcohnia quinoae TaxID=2918902 RepID=A0AAW5E9R0_9BACI|nr:type II CRISPR-associated endonuclease Cas1 [Fredinandcohnia sp. SECRCQ15]MCH1627739.1 type II CRISPR-associated endonuclease Cas1 [Fredinandcohnia sp. SECRCQ15]
MSWRHIMITQNAKLSVKHHKLVIQQEITSTIPLQDIASIIIEARGVTLTSQLLSQCAEKKIAIFTCDDKILPNGIFNCFHQHSRQLTVITTQFGLTKPFKKRIWQQIVRQKIENQALCLELLGREGANELRLIAKTVESGDTSNREAYAAKLYFQYLFENGFTRRSEDPINRLLNYGYAIMRGAVARCLTNYGFLPSLGIYHDNQLNAFNLADDFMEVLRPLVDLHVAQQESDIWDIETRAALVNLLNIDVSITKEYRSVTVAIEDMVKSFIASSRQNDTSYLKLPELLPMRAHQYE